MKIISLDQVPKMKLDMEGAKGVHKQVAISRDDGTPSFCFRFKNKSETEELVFICAVPNEYR